MSTAAIDRICRIIEEQELEVLTVTAADGSKLDHVSGTPEDLCAVVQLIPDSFDGIVVVEAYRERTGSARGRKADVDKPFKWRVQGRTNTPATPVPIERADIGSVKEAANYRADARIADHLREQVEAENAELRGRVAMLEQCIQDHHQEEEDEEEPGERSPMGSPPWWHDEDRLLRVMGYAKDLLTPKPQLPTPPAAEGVTTKELELLAAFRAWSTAHPDDAAKTTNALLATFGNGQK